MWLIWWDACGLFCFFFGEAVVMLSNYVLVTQILGPWTQWNAVGIANLVFFESIIVLVTVAHWRGMMVCPGVTEKNTATPADCKPNKEDPMWWTKPKRRYCKRCKAFKPPRAHHCSVAGRCVVKMDHYCPWMNNTVGQNNHKFFLQFLVYVFIGTAYASLVTLSYGLAVWQGWTPMPKWGMVEITLAGSQCVLDIFFAIFVCAMMCDQFEAVCTDTTGIEAMKRWEERDWTILQGLTSVMGVPLGWQWFVPTSPQGSAWYDWSAMDDPDAYDIRDPEIRQFFRQLEFEARLKELTGAEGDKAEGEGAVDASVASGGKKGKGKGKKGKKDTLPPRPKAAMERVYDEKGRPMLVPPNVAAQMRAKVVTGDAGAMDMSSLGI